MTTTKKSVNYINQQPTTNSEANMHIDPTPYSAEIIFGFPFWTVFAFIIGTCMGSFLNVCIWRIPRDESIVSPPSSCPKCGHRLAIYENCPIIGWLALRGKCKSCRQPISIQYLLMELLVGIMFTAVWLKVYYNHEYLTALIPYSIVTSLVVTTFFIDIKHYIIPNETTYFTMLAGLICAAAIPELWAIPEVIPSPLWWQALIMSAVSLIIGYGLLDLFARAGRRIFKQEALGWGDVKYMGAISAILGLKCAFFTLLVGSVLGTIIGVGMMVTKKKDAKTAIPFGPYLAVATYLWVLVGENLTQWYFALTQ